MRQCFRSQLRLLRRLAVTQRSREIAIRLALGAARSDDSKLVLRHGLTIVSIGMTIGIVA